MSGPPAVDTTSFVFLSYYDGGRDGTGMFLYDQPLSDRFSTAVDTGGEADEAFGTGYGVCFVEEVLGVRR